MLPRPTDILNPIKLHNNVKSVSKYFTSDHFFNEIQRLKINQNFEKYHCILTEDFQVLDQNVWNFIEKMRINDSHCIESLINLNYSLYIIKLEMTELPFVKSTYYALLHIDLLYMEIHICLCSDIDNFSLYLCKYIELYEFYNGNIEIITTLKKALSQLSKGKNLLENFTLDYKCYTL